MSVLNDNFSFSIFIPIRQWLAPAEMKSPKCHSTALRSMVSCVNRYCNFKPFTSPTSRRGWVNTFYCPMLIFSSLLLSTAQIATMSNRRYQARSHLEHWISGLILPHFDVRTISVASKLKELQIFLYYWQKIFDGTKLDSDGERSSGCECFSWMLIPAHTLHSGRNQAFFHCE